MAADFAAFALAFASSLFFLSFADLQVLFLSSIFPLQISYIFTINASIAFSSHALASFSLPLSYSKCCVHVEE